MRNLSSTYTACVAALSLALLTAGCDRLQSVTTAGHKEETRTTLVKDSSGKMVRLDPVTGEVTPVDRTKAPAATTAPRASKPAAKRSAAVHARVEPRTARTTPIPIRAIAPRAVITQAPPQPARIAFDEVCAAPWEPVAVTLVDTGVYAKPSVGSLLNRVVSGTLVTMNGPSGDWVRVNLEGTRGPLAGFIHCSALRPLTAAGTDGGDSGTTEEF
jgi:hypothetical protein